MRIEVTDPELIDDLVTFLCGMGYVARHEGDRTVTAFLPLAPDAHQQTDLALLLRAWSARRHVAALVV